MALTALLVTLVVIAIAFVALWVVNAKRRSRGAPGQATATPTALEVGIGFVTNFFDTLGIGSFAPTTSIFKLWKIVDDRVIPGTLNVGHALPTIAQALIFTLIIEVHVTTLILLIVAAVLGAWLGAGVVARWSRRGVQLGMGIALLTFAALLLARLLDLMPGGGLSLELTGVKLAIGLVGNFILGALMTLGIGLYAPCMIMVALLGMDPKAAFPIMMGSCAFLMPIGGLQFIRTGSYDLRASVGLAIGGIPAVLIAAYVVRELPLDVVRWLVLVVVIYTALMLLRASQAKPVDPTGK